MKYTFQTNKANRESLLKMFSLPKLRTSSLVFFNGVFSKTHSNVISYPEELIIESISEAGKKYPKLIQNYYGKSGAYIEDSFSSLNTKYSKDGVLIKITKNKQINEPFHLLFITASNNEVRAYPRNIIIFEEGSSANIIESHHSISSEIFKLRKTKYFRFIKFIKNKPWLEGLIFYGLGFIFAFLLLQILF